MELGEKLRQARLAAGLSQRQLCGEKITRNMLSLIENGSAQPSMDTLSYLAARLGKPMAYFWGETQPAALIRAREFWAAGNPNGVLEALDQEAKQQPEGRHLWKLALLAAGEQALQEGRLPYARELLEDCGGIESLYWSPEQERRRKILLAKASPDRRGEILAALPPEDAELLLRAEESLRQGQAGRCAAILEAAGDKAQPEWLLLRGDAHAALGEFSQAAQCFHQAEAFLPEKVHPRLERCYRELRDFERAYYYAVKQRQG